jgi:hypothetical protein
MHKVYPSWEVFKALQTGCGKCFTYLQFLLPKHFIPPPPDPLPHISALWLIRFVNNRKWPARVYDFYVSAEQIQRLKFC